jgi:Lrp/AsnC family leucine-responsive transcriptional regulator
MKFHQSDADVDSVELDSIDLGILDLLQENCKQSLAQIGEKVGLKAPSVLERIHKLEEAGIVQGYSALLDARLLGKDVTAFIGVSLAHPRHIDGFERELAAVPDVLESHHVTGEHTLMLKVKTRNTASLERLIGWVRCIEGVTRTETLVVLSSQRESLRVPLDLEGDATREKGRRAGPRGRRSSRRNGDGGQEQEGRS